MILYQKFEYNKDEWAKFVASAIFAATQHRLGTLLLASQSESQWLAQANRRLSSATR